MKAKHEAIRSDRLFYCFVDFGKTPDDRPAARGGYYQQGHRRSRRETGTRARTGSVIEVLIEDIDRLGPQTHGSIALRETPDRLYHRRLTQTHDAHVGPLLGPVPDLNWRQEKISLAAIGRQQRHPGALPSNSVQPPHLLALYGPEISGDNPEISLATHELTLKLVAT